MRSIETSFIFDAGHRILNLQPIEEQAIHGHTFNVKLIIKSEKLDKNAIIVDRNYLSSALHPLIKELDHSFILFEKDPIVNDIKNLAGKFGFQHKIIIIPINPTIEGITEYIFNRIKTLLPSQKIEVKIHASESLESSYSE